MAILMDEMLRATALTRSGNLHEATLVIQRALGLVAAVGVGAYYLGKQP